MKTTTPYVLLGLALGYIAYSLFAPKPPSPNVYQGKVAVSFNPQTPFDVGGWWGTIYAAIKHRDLERIREEHGDSTIQAYPFSVKQESFYIHGTAFGVKVVAVQIDSVKVEGKSDMTITPKGDIEFKPITPGLALSSNPNTVNLGRNKIHLWTLVGAQIIAPYTPTIIVGAEWRNFGLGVGWLSTAPGIALTKRF